MAVIAHVSDLHFGREDPRLVEALVRDLTAARPDLLAVSGDLTQRARRIEFAAARAFLDRIEVPRLVVPGNHDIPLVDLVRRFSRPLGRYRRYIAEETDPFLATAHFAALGVNTARSNVWKNGRLSVAQIDSIRSRFCPLPPEVFKVLVAHHPFLPPPDDPAPALVGRGPEALVVAEECGVDLILSGHLHRGFTGDIRAHHVTIRRSILVAQASTATSHRTRNEANGYNLIRYVFPQLEFTQLAWDGQAFRPTRHVSYEKLGTDWRPVR
jgi:3',5'-cyclic AMP phosphodiesterase CpdA